MILLVIRSALYAIFFYGVTILWVAATFLASLLGQKPLLKTVRGWGITHRWLCRWILGQKIVVIGDLPDEPMLMVFKHESMFETIDVLCMFEAPAIAAKQELLDIPGWGNVAQRYGLIGIDRESGAKALRHLKRQAAAAVKAGRPIVLFPEGTRVPHGTRAPLRSGFAAIYQLLGLPVLPVAVDSGRLSPRGSFLKRPGVITYKVGEVIPPGLPRAEAEARAEEAINALNRV